MIMNYDCAYFKKSDLTVLKRRFPKFDWSGDVNAKQPGADGGAFGADILHRNIDDYDLVSRILETYLLECERRMARARYEIAMGTASRKSPDVKSLDFDPTVRPYAEWLQQVEDRLGELGVPNF
jgi:hypothetical protein